MTKRKRKSESKSLNLKLIEERIEKIIRLIQEGELNKANSAIMEKEFHRIKKIRYFYLLKPHLKKERAVV